MTIIPWNKEDDDRTIFWEKIQWDHQELLIGLTELGICFLGFNTLQQSALKDLQRRYTNPLQEKKYDSDIIEYIESFLKGGIPPFNLHVKGTPFQISIWHQLVKIPAGSITTYGQLGPSPQHARATGTAVGKNPVSIFIPCHRVIQYSGKWEQYYWGATIKKILLQKEGVILK